MKKIKMNPLENRRWRAFVYCGILCSASISYAANEYAGLWVGRVALTHATEVVVSLDENNIPIAPNPEVPTPTHDAAFLRLILHVNGSGQVNLLKDVAILRREEADVALAESDYVLVTDERLYTDFPVQQATRIASAVFDFGDFNSSAAVDALVDSIVDQVALSVSSSSISATSSIADIRLAEDTAQRLAEEEVDVSGIILNADVAKSFADFMVTEFTASTLDTIAVAADPAAEAADLLNLAEGIRTNSFYGDSRPVDAVNAVVLAAQGATNEVEKLSAARFVASRYADTDNRYQRFLTGRDFRAMIPAASQLAAVETLAANATEISISDAVDLLDEVLVVEGAVPAAQVLRYSDTAAQDAFDQVLNAIKQAAISYTNSVTSASVIASAAETAGWAVFQTLPRFTLPPQSPTDDYTAFVRTNAFENAVSVAAEAAALAAVAEKKIDPFSNEKSLAGVARIAAIESLRSVYIMAAQARRAEQPMVGEFGGVSEPALTCTLDLPASHPTNPFRHIKHPDHTVGLDIQRLIELEFDGAVSNQLERTQFGADQISGTYREEIFGLHKPLGPAPDTNPLGLRVAGTFELSRISRVDTLNAE